MFLEPGSLRNLQGKCVRSQYKSIGISKNWINKDPKMYTNGEVTKKRLYIVHQKEIRFFLSQNYTNTMSKPKRENEGGLRK